MSEDQKAAAKKAYEENLPLILDGCQKWEEDLQQGEWFKERPPAVQELMKQWPQWGFYQYKESKAPVRIWGVMERINDQGGEELAFHACCAHLGWVNETIGGITPDLLERTDKWSGHQLTIINSLPFQAASAFMDPRGFIFFVNPSYQQD